MGLFKKKPRDGEPFTSVGVWVKTRDLIREGAAKERIPIYQYVHHLVMLAQNKPKGGSDGRA